MNAGHFVPRGPRPGAPSPRARPCRCASRSRGASFRHRRRSARRSLVGTTDRGGVELDASLTLVGSLRGIPAVIERRVRRRRAPRTGAFEGDPFVCARSAGERRHPARASSQRRCFDAIAAGDVVAARRRRDARRHRPRAEPGGSLDVASPAQTATTTLDGVGAQIALGDLDQDGAPEIVTSAADGDDAITVCELGRRERSARAAPVSRPRAASARSASARRRRGAPPRSSRSSRTRCGLSAEHRPPRTRSSPPRRSPSRSRRVLARAPLAGVRRARSRSTSRGRSASIDPHRIDDATAAILGERALRAALRARTEGGGDRPRARRVGPRADARRPPRRDPRAGIRTARDRPIDARDALCVDRARAHRSARAAGSPTSRRRTLDGRGALVFPTARRRRSSSRALAVAARRHPPRELLPRAPRRHRALPRRSPRRRARPRRAARARPTVPRSSTRSSCALSPDLAAPLRAFEAGEDAIGWLGSGLHEPRPGAKPFDFGAVAWADPSHRARGGHAGTRRESRSASPTASRYARVAYLVLGAAVADAERAGVGRAAVRSPRRATTRPGSSSSRRPSPRRSRAPVTR